MPYKDREKDRAYKREWIKNKLARQAPVREEVLRSLSTGFISYDQLNEAGFAKDLKTYRDCLERAKEQLLGRKTDRIVIASLAIKACEIVHGGNWKENQQRHTLRKFAKDSGVNPKTLYEWVSVKKKVLDKLPHGIQFLDYSAARLAIYRRSTDPIKAYIELTSGGRELMWKVHIDRYVRNALAHLRKHGRHGLSREERELMITRLKECISILASAD